MNIEKNIENIELKIKKTCDKTKRKRESVKLIAVSKTKPAEAIIEAFNCGVKNFGENYIQEAIEKIDEISNPEIIWHYIGALQKNKAKFAVKYFDIIHSVDSVKLAVEIDKRALAEKKIQDILIQINTGREKQKAGILPENAISFFDEIKNFMNINIRGLMSIPPFGMKKEEAKKHFSLLKETKDKINSHFENINLTELSMGMTGDFETAIEEGSTMVRIGTAIFGEREIR